MSDIPEIVVDPGSLAILASLMALGNKVGKGNADMSWHDYFEDAYSLVQEANQFILMKEAPFVPTQPIEDPLIRARVTMAKAKLNSSVVDEAVAVQVVYKFLKDNGYLADRVALSLVAAEARRLTGSGAHSSQFDGPKGKARKLFLSIWHQNPKLISTSVWSKVLNRAVALYESDKEKEIDLDIVEAIRDFWKRHPSVSSTESWQRLRIEANSRKEVPGQKTLRDSASELAVRFILLLWEQYPNLYTNWKYFNALCAKARKKI